MGTVSMEELLKRCPSVYKLVVVAAKRAKAISEGAPKLVEGEYKKVASVALEEIRQGKVVYHAEDEGDGRKGKSKKEHKERAKKK